MREFFFPDELTEIAFFALKRHSDQHNMYLDDYPSAEAGSYRASKTVRFL